MRSYLEGMRGKVELDGREENEGGDSIRSSEVITFILFYRFITQVYCIGG